MKGSRGGRSQVSAVSGCSYLENEGVIDIVTEAGQGVSEELDGRVETLSLASGWAGPGSAPHPSLPSLLSMGAVTQLVTRINASIFRLISRKADLVCFFTLHLPLQCLVHCRCPVNICFLLLFFVGSLCRGTDHEIPIFKECVARETAEWYFGVILCRALRQTKKIGHFSVVDNQRW